MDPNEALSRMIELAKKYDRADLTVKDMQEFFETFMYLSDWLKAGGFLPDAWNVKKGEVK